MQTYDGPGFPIVHADFYRLRGADELTQLGWEETIDGAVTLVEWPERAGERAASRPARDRASRFDFAKQATTSAASNCRRTATPPAVSRARAPSSGCLLAPAGRGARRAPLHGDASTRAYERLTRADGRDARS